MNKLEQALKNKKDKIEFYNENEDKSIFNLFDKAKEDYDEFEKRSWELGEGLKAPNFDMMTNKMENFTPGLYIFAGESNHGKTALMTNIAYDIAAYEPNNAFLLYFSIDDSKNEIIPRLIAMNELIPIGICAKPQRYKTKIDNAEEQSSLYREQLKKRSNGLENLKKLSNRLKIEDGTDYRLVENIKEYIENALIFLKGIDEKYKLIVSIDALHDLDFKNKSFKDKNDKYAEVAKTLKQWSNDYDIVIFTSAHMKKLDGNRRPVLDDVKESNTILYEASVVFLLYNDVSKNKGAAKVFTKIQEDAEVSYENISPVIEIDWAKNKKSSYKGRTYVNFLPNYSKATELGIETTKRLDSVICAL